VSAAGRRINRSWERPVIRRAFLGGGRIQEPDWKPASESHPAFAFDLTRKYEVCRWFFTSNRGGFAVDVPQEDYDRIAALISSDTSPVGIDAKKTHVIILHKLEEIEKRLVMLEQEAET
jgi:hypothetical protein